MPTSRTDSVQTTDGSFQEAVWLPDGGTGPGILLVQEIFGVSDYIRAVAEDLAGLGYVVAAPDLFWRLKPQHDAAHDEAGLAESLDLGSRFDFEQGIADAAAGLAHLRSLPEVDGGTGVLGFCLGGSIAYFLAAQGGLDAAVSFYGSAVPGSLTIMEEITVQVQFHFGGADPYIPRAGTTWRFTSRKTPGTPSTTARRRCSTCPSPPRGPGSAPRSSWPGTCRSGRSPGRGHDRPGRAASNPARWGAVDAARAR
jgi:carboxymethylenebutenolidase